MNRNAAIRHLAADLGIARSYVDLSGQRQPTSEQTNLALLRASGLQLDNDAMIMEALRETQAAQRERKLPVEMIIVAGEAISLPVPADANWHLMIEGTDLVFAEGTGKKEIELPPMPSGIHKLITSKDETIRLIVAPKSAPAVEDLTGKDRLWGINLALYGLHSKRNPSIGDYEDLARTSETFATQGADFLGINPVHCLGWKSSDVISPYSPTHRGFLNTRHIAVDQITPASNRTKGLISSWRQSSKKQNGELIDYDDHAHHQHPILRALYADFLDLGSHEERTDFQIFCEREGQALQDFADFEAGTEKFGANWKAWPIASKQAPESVPEGSAFHMWLQWHAETQLQNAQQRARAAGMPFGLYLDLAVGARRNGAEAWAGQDSIAEGVSIGAPPDHLSPAGQNWDLAAFDPKKLAATDYRAFRSVLARNMRHCGILRIDHVLGLNRSFWIPDDGSPGGYVSHNFDALLAIVRIEAERNKCVVIGEDLGLVPAGFRKTLQESGLYSYSVLQYEKTPSGAFRKPARLRKKSLACFGTHDTPTLTGFSQGRDIDWWQKLGWINEQAAKAAHIDRKRECEQLASLSSSQIKHEGNGEFSELNQSIHSALANSPVAMLSVQLDDIECLAEAQNLPGTVAEHPNWQRRCPTPVDAFPDHRGLKQIGKLATKCGRGISKAGAP